MASNFLRKLFLSVPIILCSFIAAQAQDQSSSSWATDVGSRYWVQPDIVYQGANNTLLKLDVWYQHDVKTPSPTLVYFHGGGWIFGTKEGSVLQFLPFLEKGWTVVNVEYRMAIRWRPRRWRTHAVRCAGFTATPDNGTSIPKRLC